MKDCLKRDDVRKITQEMLDKITFNINAHPQEVAVGSAVERFFGRTPRNYLPNSINRFVDHHKLIENRKNKQVEISQKKGRSAPNDFEPGNRVIIQWNLSKRWNIPGAISEKRISEDGSARSFLVEKEDGRTVIRNSRFIKRTWKNSRAHVSRTDPVSAEVGGADRAVPSYE